MAPFSRSCLLDVAGGDSDPERAQLPDDTEVAPAAVLAREPEDERADRRVERRTARPPLRGRPAVSDELAVPAHERLRRDEERRPRAARQDAAQRSKQQPVAPRQPRARDLTAQDRQLVPQHDDLEILRMVATASNRISS